MFIEKISTFLRFVTIVLLPNYKTRKTVNFFFKTVLGGIFVVIWVAVISYYLAWTIIAKNTKHSIKHALYDYIRSSEETLKIIDFDGIKISGFPFFMNISIDKLFLKTSFINVIEIDGLIFQSEIFNNEKLTLINLDKVIIQPNDKDAQYIIAYNKMPFLTINKNNNNILQKISYKDTGYRVIEAKSGEIFDHIEKNAFEYQSRFDSEKNKYIYSVDVMTNIKVKENKMQNLDEILIKLALTGEKTDDNNTITINNMIFKTPIFVINGYGSIIAKKGDDNIFNINLELAPYKVIIDFIANYFLTKNDLLINKEDIGRYYTAINQTILPKINGLQLSDVLKLSIASNPEDKITINNLSLNAIFTELASARYNIIYENPPPKKSFYSSENIVDTGTAEEIS